MSGKVNNGDKKLDDIRAFITFHLSLQKADYVMKLIEEYGDEKDDAGFENGFNEGCRNGG